MIVAGDRRDRRDASLCAFILCAVTLATWPELEGGFIDDWAFAYMAAHLASSGHLQYNGWSEPIIGFQAYWAAFFIRIFGFSFTIVRLSALPFTMGSAALLYRLSRYAGLARAPSFLATLTVALSPVAIALSGSFMTDVPAYFFLLATVYSALLALERPDRSGCILWLTISVALGFLGGTIRQPDWGLPLLIIPAVAYLRRRKRSVLLVSAALYAALACGMAATIHWFRAQPYALDSISTLSVSALATPTQPILSSLIIIFLSLFLFVLPAWSGYVYLLPVMIRRRRPLILGSVFFGALFLALIYYRSAFLSHAPWLGNTQGDYGILPPTADILGLKPRLLSVTLTRALALLTFCGLSVSLAFFLDGVLSRRPARSQAGPAESPLLRIAALTLPFATGYLLLSLFRELTGSLLFDRYLIVLMPVLSIALLLHFQNRMGEHIPAVCWVALSTLAVYGICTTHDAFAMRRARVRAAGFITSSGVPRRCISAGLEYDGWTQITEGRYINDPKIHSPVDAYKKPAPLKLPVDYWYWYRTPKIDPHFILSLSPLPGLASSGFPPVSYMAWLPPGERKVWTQIATECDCAAPGAPRCGKRP